VYEHTRRIIKLVLGYDILTAKFYFLTVLNYTTELTPVALWQSVVCNSIVLTPTPNACVGVRMRMENVDIL